MIQLESVSKGYGGQPLFREITWTITSGERIGLVGPNGAGKTTICRILAAVEEPDEGRVSQARGTTVGYLPQEVAVSGDQVGGLRASPHRVLGRLAHARGARATPSPAPVPAAPR